MAIAAEPTADAFLGAQATIKSFLHRTPLIASASLSAMTGTTLYLKAENLQKTGSFKPRGALAALAHLSPDERARGVITMSAGNHGQGLAYAAAQFGCQCTVVIREDATRSKLEAMRTYGADLVFTPVARWRERLDEEQERRGQVFIHPFANPDVVTGQGTVGLEILEDLLEVDTIVVPVGGGGLISGIATAVKQRRPSVRIVGVEPQGAAVVHLSLERGTPQRLERLDTIADGLAAPWTEQYTLEIIRRYVDEVVLVSDSDLAAALVTILERTKLLVEPAGSAAVAALLTHKIGTRHGGQTVAVLSGGNADVEKLQEVFSMRTAGGTKVKAIRRRIDSGQSTLEWVVGAAIILGTLVIGILAWNRGLVSKINQMVQQLTNTQ